MKRVWMNGALNGVYALSVSMAMWCTPQAALAQAAALLTFDTLDTAPDDNTVYYFAGIDGARFKRPVEPGDQLKMQVEILRQSRGIWKFKALATVDGHTAVEAELMCTMRSIADPTESV